MTHPSPARAKARLRETVLKKREALGEEARRAASMRIRERLFALPAFRQARGVHCFVSLPQEVETEPIFQACWAAGKQTFVPYQIRSEGRLGWARRNPEDELVRGPFGVPEPPPAMRRPVALDEISLVLVPGVAFDRAGNRIGYGKGFYDFFLAEMAQNDVKVKDSVKWLPAGRGIALAFAAQIVPSVPREEWDVRVGAIVTENELILPSEDGP